MKKKNILVIKLNDQATAAAAVEISRNTIHIERDDRFKLFVQDVVQIVLDNRINRLEDLKAFVMPDNNMTVHEMIRYLIKTNVGATKISSIKSKISLKKVHYIEKKSTEKDSFLGICTNGHIGAIVEVRGGSQSLAKDLAIQVVATIPEKILQQNVKDDIDDLITESVIAGKPADIIDKIVEKKSSVDNSEFHIILGARLFKDQTKTVTEALKKENAKIVSFIRLETSAETIIYDPENQYNNQSFESVLKVNKLLR